jgi:hypothetical protein
MNKIFDIQPLNDGVYKFISFSLTSDRLDDYRRDLESELSKFKTDGWVLLDLISSNGMKTKRFASLYFDGITFDVQTYKNPRDINSKIEDKCLSFYKKHIYAIENSVLTKPQKFLFKKKLNNASSV